MKRLFPVVLAAMLALGMAAGSGALTGAAQAADARNVNVINETGYDIRLLGFNGPDDGLEEWDNELTSPLRDGASTYVKFDEDEDEGCVWNIKVAWVGYSEAESVYWKNVNLCRITALRLRYNSKTDTTSFVAE
jgi:hypothetical protein